MWLFKKLTRASPLQILLAYALAMLLFAGLYTLWPLSFYHPYIRYEPAARARKAQLEEILRAAVSAEFQREPIMGDKVSYEELARVEIGGERDGRLLATAVFRVAFATTDNPQFVLKVPLLVFAFDVGMSVGTHTVRPLYVTADPSRGIEDESVMPHGAAERKLVSNIVAHAIERVQLDKSQAALVATVLCTEQGLQCASLGDFGRMLYFSATTITTVGYGDVVPLSGLARAAAAVEATLGIVLLGLFVTSLHRLRTENREPNPPSRGAQP